MEYELLDTGVFKEDRYFDVFVEYAKDGPEDILVRITAANRGPEAAELHLLPTLWFRNDWSSWIAESNRAPKKPNLRQIEAAAGTSAVAAAHPQLGELILSCEGEVPLLFTENETNHARLFPGQKNESPYVKDGINDCVVQGNQGAVNPGKQGTKVAAHYRLMVGPRQSSTVRLRLTSQANAAKSIASSFGMDFDKILTARLQEADDFYRSVTPPSVSPDAAKVMRQALAGMLWSKQFFFFDGDNWLDEHLCLPRIVSVALNAHPCGTLIADLIDELATLLTVALGGLAVSASPRRVPPSAGNPFCERTQFCISKSLVGEIKEKWHFRSGRQTSMQSTCSG
jgi:hypothetical protein